MRLVPALDMMNNTEEFVSGISAVTEVAPGVLRVTYYTLGEDDEGRQNYFAGRHIWAASLFLDAMHMATAAWQELQAMKRPRIVQAAVH